MKGELRTQGFKADLSKVCGCELFVVGRTKKDLIDNFRRHEKDVHRLSRLTKRARQRLERAVEEI